MPSPSVLLLEGDITDSPYLITHARSFGDAIRIAMYEYPARELKTTIPPGEQVDMARQTPSPMTQVPHKVHTPVLNFDDEEEEDEDESIDDLLDDEEEDDEDDWDDFDDDDDDDLD